MADSTPSLVAFLLAAIHAIGILSAIRALVTARTAPGAIAWAFSLVTLPYVAVPAFSILGRHRLNGYGEALRERRVERR